MATLIKSIYKKIFKRMRRHINVDNSTITIQSKLTLVPKKIQLLYSDTFIGPDGMYHYDIIESFSSYEAAEKFAKENNIAKYKIL